MEKKTKKAMLFVVIIMKIVRKVHNKNMQN